MNDETEPQVRQLWWCPTCQRRIPQPRWMHVGKPTQRSYHLLGTIAHDIERWTVVEDVRPPS